MSIRNLAILLFVLIMLLFGLSLFAGFEASRSSASSAAPVKSASAYPPPLTSAVKAQLAAHPEGFQYLVSYTGRGFEPMTVTIKKGDTVRFTNNSSEDLWVASAGTPVGNVYPTGTSTECGQSAFDSCLAIGRGAFWEFTFTAAGTWGYQNNRDTKQTGIILVQ